MEGLTTEVKVFAPNLLGAVVTVSGYSGENEHDFNNDVFYLVTDVEYDKLHIVDRRVKTYTLYLYELEGVNDMELTVLKYQDVHNLPF